MSSEFKARSEEKEGWLAGLPEGEERGATRPQLLATAALLHGALKGIEVPEEARQRSHQRVQAVWAARVGDRPRDASPQGDWWHTLSGLLRVVFTLGRRR
jgi:hypothetical protein